MKQLKKRLDALEQAEKSGPRFPDMTPALMLAYGTENERAAWEAAGPPEVTRARIGAALDVAYVVLVPDDAGRLIVPDGQPWQDDGRTVVDLDE
jgi:hypothetical protein